ncbi:MAG: hypothetical protein P4L53_25615 [Candidatus Obscuribacterales bacterium]|nr:hypothetical protein [Candidatus Obscuribacterales bacterium]
MSTRLGFVHAIFGLFLLAASAAPSFAISESTSVTNSIDATRLGAVEWRLFAHPYEKDSDDKRLSRLERLVFGAERQDLDAASRFVKILAALSASNKESRSGRNLATVNLPSRSIVGTPTQPSNMQKSSGRSSVIGIQSNYPSVSELEAKVFSSTYVTMPVATRLQNLEIRVFGKVSQSDDLCCRVDALNDYVNATVSTPKKIPFSWLCNFVDPAMLPQRVHATTVVDRIETMETNLFGKTFANKTLEKRVSLLEKNIVGVTAENSSQDLSVRVAQLWTRLQSPKVSKA